MRANTVLFLGAISSHSMLTEIDQPTYQHFALLPPPKLRAFAIPLCPMSCSPLTNNEPVTSLFPTDWNYTQRGESYTGLQPKGLVTQVTPGPFLWPFHLWGNILSHFILTSVCLQKMHTDLLIYCICGLIILHQWLCPIIVIFPESGLNYIFLHNNKVYLKLILKYNTAAFTVSSQQLPPNTLEATSNYLYFSKMPFSGGKGG